MSVILDLGEGVSFRWVNCRHGERTHGIVSFGSCEGLISFCSSCHDPEVWTVYSTDPLTIEPSVQCTEHSEHHGFIRQSKWEKC